MLDLNTHEGRSPKCYFTTSTLPSFINHEQPSMKKRPFSTIHSQTFSHSLTVMLPDTRAAILEKAVTNDIGTLRYLTVYMKLSDIIEGDFFNQYIRSGNILMRSEGRPGIDHIFSLHEGVLRLEVDKATFERMGLEGKAIPNEGRKHVKARYAVELNLRLPSMLRGKSGFQRIVWAFKNALNHSVKWLFCNLNGPNDGTGPISGHFPTIKEVAYRLQSLKEVDVPVFPDELNDRQQEDVAEMLEWLTLAMEQSPRVRSDDDIDPYLSRYSVPVTVDTSTGTARRTPHDLAIFQWRGFIHPAFIQGILLTTLKASGEEWFALSAKAFDGKAYNFLQDKERTLNWEYHD